MKPDVLRHRAVIVQDEMLAQPQVISDEDMGLINAHALEPLRPDEVYVFNCIPSNDRIDSYYTRMTARTLRNYAEDLRDGVALMYSHRDRDTLPLGQSIMGHYDEDKKEVHARFFLQRGLNNGVINTDMVIKGIAGGTYRDVSVGFLPGWYKCSICGGDIQEVQRCEHVPGVEYDGSMCYAWVEDGRLAEVSIVYDGSTPGAIITKAMEVYRAGGLAPKDVMRLESALQVRFPECAGRKFYFLDKLADSVYKRRRVGMNEEYRGVIPYSVHGDVEKAPEETPWDAGAEVKKADIDDLKIMCAWYDSENPNVKSSYKLPHHQAKTHNVVWNGVRGAMAALMGARGGVDVPEEDRKGIYNHLVRHYEQFDKEPPEFRSSNWEESDNEWRYKVRPPSAFHADSFRTVTLANGVRAVVGRVKEDPGPKDAKAMKCLSLRFSKDTFRSLEEAEGWLNRQNPGIEGGEQLEKDTTEEEVMKEEAQEVTAETLMATALISWEEEKGERYSHPDDVAIKEILGVSTPAEAERIKEEAEIGRRYVNDLIEAVVAERIRAQGSEKVDIDKYRRMLAASRDIDFLMSELESYGGTKATIFSGKRVSEGPMRTDPEQEKAAREFREAVMMENPLRRGGEF